MIIGTQILDHKLPSVAEGLACDRLFLVLEERVAELHPDLLPQLQSALPEAICRTLRGGEECKTRSRWGSYGLGSAKRELLVVVPSSSLVGEPYLT